MNIVFLLSFSAFRSRLPVSSDVISTRMRKRRCFADSELEAAMLDREHQVKVYETKHCNLTERERCSVQTLPFPPSATLTSIGRPIWNVCHLSIATERRSADADAFILYDQRRAPSDDTSRAHSKVEESFAKGERTLTSLDEDLTSNRLDIKTITDNSSHLKIPSFIGNQHTALRRLQTPNAADNASPLPVAFVNRCSKVNTLHSSCNISSNRDRMLEPEVKSRTCRMSGSIRHKWRPVDYDEIPRKLCTTQSPPGDDQQRQVAPTVTSVDINKPFSFSVESLLAR